MGSPSSDQEHWDARYERAVTGAPVPHVQAVLSSLPSEGRALDLAGGSGGTALLLAAQGLQVTLADLSPVALELGRDEAERRSLKLQTVCLDLEVESVPSGPWDVIVCANFLQRELFEPMIAELAPGGLLVVAIATVTNFDRNERPGRRHLLERGELAGLAGELEILQLDEDWFGDRHEARLVGRRIE